MTTTITAPAPVRVDIPRDDWRELSLCSQTDPEAFFPGKGEDTRVIRGICERCPVRWECLADDIDNTDPSGFRAGLAARRRTNLRKSGVNRAAVLAAGRDGLPALLARASRRKG